MALERDRLKAWLREHGIRQETVAPLAKTTPATISRVLSGKQLLRPEIARNIVAAFRKLGCEDIDGGRLMIESDLEPEAELSSVG